MSHREWKNAGGSIFLIIFLMLTLVVIFGTAAAVVPSADNWRVPDGERSQDVWITALVTRSWGDNWAIEVPPDAIENKDASLFRWSKIAQLGLLSTGDITVELTVSSGDAERSSADDLGSYSKARPESTREARFFFDKLPPTEYEIQFRVFEDDVMVADIWKGQLTIEDTEE